MEIIVGILAVTVAAAGVVATIFAGDIRRWFRPPKSEAAPNPTDRTAVVGIVVRDRDVLMVQRKGNDEPLTWQFPAGELRPNRDPREKLTTEIFAETGVKVRVVAQIGERLHPDTGVHCLYFRCAYQEGEARNLDSGENSDVAWIAAKRVADYISSDLDPAVAALLAEIAGSQDRE